MEDIQKLEKAIEIIKEDIINLRIQDARFISLIKSETGEGGTYDRQFERVAQGIKETKAELKKDIKDLSDIIYGDGNGKKGILIKLDRQEQFNIKLYWLIGLVVSILIKMIFDFLKK